MEDMNDNWDQRKGKSVKKDVDKNVEPSGSSSSSSLYSLENIKRDYRLTKQKIHAGLWVKEIEKLEEAKLGNSLSGGDDIEKLLDSASEYVPLFIAFIFVSESLHHHRSFVQTLVINQLLHFGISSTTLSVDA